MFQFSREIHLPRSFIRAFEQTTELRTDDSDKLYYLLQYTAGDPQYLVHSCEHMAPTKAFGETKGQEDKSSSYDLTMAQIVLVLRRSYERP